MRYDKASELKIGTWYRLRAGTLVRLEKSQALTLRTTDGGEKVVNEYISIHRPFWTATRADHRKWKLAHMLKRIAENAPMRTPKAASRRTRPTETCYDAH